MNNLLSKFSLYDLIAMVIPGFTILLFLSSLLGHKWNYCSCVTNSMVFWIVVIALSYIIGLVNEFLCRNLWSGVRNNVSIINKQLKVIIDEIGEAKYLPKYNTNIKDYSCCSCMCLTSILGMAIIGILEVVAEKILCISSCRCYYNNLFILLLYFGILKGIAFIINHFHDKKSQSKKLLDHYYEAYYYVQKSTYNNTFSIIEGQVAFLQNMLIPISLFLILPLRIYSNSYGTPLFCNCDCFYCVVKVLLASLLALMIYTIHGRIAKIHYLVWSDYEYLKRIS